MVGQSDLMAPQQNYQHPISFLSLFQALTAAAFDIVGGVLFLKDYMANKTTGNTPSICFIYGLDLRSREANVHQTLCMLNSLAQQADVTFLTNWVKPSELRATFEFFNIEPKFKTLRIPVPFITRWIFLERITRLLYCFVSYIYLKRNRESVIFTRDFAFLYFISLVDPNFRKSRKILYEQHKIYHLVTNKTSYQNELRALRVPNLIISISKPVRNDLLSIFKLKRKGHNDTLQRC